jgi:hypothetical protein
MRTVYRRRQYRCCHPVVFLSFCVCVKVCGCAHRVHEWLFLVSSLFFPFSDVCVLVSSRGMAGNEFQMLDAQVRP